MPWKIKFDSRPDGSEASIPIDDLSIDDLSKVVNGRDENGLPKYPYLNWMQLRNSPATEPQAFYDLVCNAARRLDLPVPDRPANVGAYVTFVNDHIDFAADDLPSQFGDNGLPLGTTGDQTTGSSSISNGSEGGTPIEPDEQP